MPTIQILLLVTKDVGTDTDDPPGPGHRFVFTNDLVLERYDDSTPGNGLPVNQEDRLAGTHSGVVTLVRVADATDEFFPDGSELWAYDATYRFNTLDNTPLQKGQVTARGVHLYQGVDRLDLPVRFAITGGTGPYATAHGTITEGVPTEDHRLLDIEL
jgi:hypothetical protein